MRKPEYLSPSSLSSFEKNPEEYYIRYLADVRAPKIPQTLPMSVGSAFDAYVKSFIHESLFGKQAKDSEKYQFDNLFQSQVEVQNRDEAMIAGHHCFVDYKDSGALADLMLELNNAVDEPRFEFDLKGEVSGHREGITKSSMGVVLMGKPDLRYINGQSAEVIHDWKVNGYCGKANTSPTKGYIKCREREKMTNMWYNSGCHKDCKIEIYKGMNLNRGSYLEDNSPDWATQLCTYGWLMGSQVGRELITSVDQIVGKNSGKKPILRIATHRSLVSEQYQFEVMARYQHLWSIIHSDPFHFFVNLPLADSQARCEALDSRSKMLGDPDLTSDERWLLEMGRL